MARPADGRTGEHGAALRLQPGGQELTGRGRVLIRGIHAQRDVPGRGELRGEPGQPGACGARPGRRAHQEEVAPPEARVVRAADDQIVAAVGDLGPLEDP
jgi:hypothetical protein